ncbi:phage virion morphogenesis protein [Flavobacterium sp. N1994]|uniref:phage virion morphogenesis protein n=1 Tax=Flavobacterium sp. N1994 TaxID=2986827 RepID=UPI002222AE34|nr:phage virion morphogenesis protein [Flavobacterium sp. N1994]
MITKIPDFNGVAKKLIKDAQTIAEVEMINFIMGNFEKQGFMDGSLQPWQARKGNTDSGRAILTKSSALRDSISISSSSSKRVVATATAKHAKIHNEGGILKIPVTAKMKKYFWYMFKKTGQSQYRAMALTKKSYFEIKMPKRQFMGDSATFRATIQNKFIKMIESRFKAV